MNFWDNTGGSSIDLGTCTSTTGTLTWALPYYGDATDTNQYTYYNYYTDPKLLEIIKEVLVLLKQVLKEKRKKR